MTAHVPDRDRQAIIVAGVHRSGTSALTRVVNLLGAGISRDLDPANESNRTGHWEPRKLQAFDDRLLAAQGLQWDDWGGATNAVPDSAKAQFLSEAVALLNEDIGRDSLFVIKDPRICLVIPFWEEAFASAGIASAYLIPLRSPFEVARSLSDRNGFSVQTGLAIWARNALEAEAATRDRRRAYSTYDALQQDWRSTIDTMCQRTGIKLPKRHDEAVEGQIDVYIDPNQRHHLHPTQADGEHTGLEDLARRIHEALQRLVNEPEAPEALASLDQLRVEFAGVMPGPGTSLPENGRQPSTAHPIDQIVHLLSALPQKSRLWAEVRVLDAERRMRLAGKPASAIQNEQEKAESTRRIEELEDNIAVLKRERDSSLAVARKANEALTRDRDSSLAAALQANEALIRDRDSSLAAAREANEALTRDRDSSLAAAREANEALTRDRDSSLAAALQANDVLEDADGRLQAELLHTRAVLDHPVRTLNQHLMSALLRRFARWTILPDRRRDRFLRSAGERDPKRIFVGLQALSEDLGRYRGRTQLRLRQLSRAALGLDPEPDP